MPHIQSTGNPVSSHLISSLAPQQFIFITADKAILSKDETPHNSKHSNGISSHTQIKAKIFAMAYKAYSTQLLSYLLLFFYALLLAHCQL
jgi:hypothetical protein